MSNNINKRRLIIIGSIMMLLVIPLIATRITTEIQWSGFDFLVAGILLATFGLIIEMIIVSTKKLKTRWIFFTILCVVAILLWAEMAVGIFGSAIAGN